MPAPIGPAGVLRPTAPMLHALATLGGVQTHSTEATHVPVTSMSQKPLWH